ncbi:MAG: pilus assembly protein PilM, partial [Kofleriaceae bacterium]|nr:pilus assembly protein PilM [Kofleriaceae bacterium]
MASRIVGIDLGAYSVKVVVTNPGFRQAMVTDVIEVKVPEGEESQLVRAASALASVGNRFQSDDDSIFSSIAGDSVFLHVLEFGFKTMRRADLDRVVGSELEGVLPIDLEDMVYAFEEIPRLVDSNSSDVAGADPDVLDLSDSALVGSGTVADSSSVQRGRIAETAMGMRVLAAATQRDRAEELLFALRSEGVDPRGLLATPAPYARLADKLGGQSGRLVAILDIGHKRTDFCLSKGGKPVYARTIARGGEELTRIIARTWKLETPEAEELKHRSGFIESRREIATSEAARSMSEVLNKQLRPLMREIRRTLQACRAKTGYTAEEIVLVGGGSRLSGMAPYLSEGLKIPVRLLSQENVMSMLGDCAATASLDTCSLALGVATDGASAKPSFDLRQGALAFAG